MPDFNPTQYAVPLFVVAVLAEMIWAKFRAPEAYEPKDTLVSLMFGLGSTVAGALLGGFALTLFIKAYEYRIFDFGPQWWAEWWRGRFASFSTTSNITGFTVPGTASAGCGRAT